MYNTSKAFGSRDIYLSSLSSITYSEYTDTRTTAYELNPNAGDGFSLYHILIKSFKILTANKKSQRIGLFHLKYLIFTTIFNIFFFWQFTLPPAPAVRRPHFTWTRLGRRHPPTDWHLPPSTFSDHVYLGSQPTLSLQSPHPDQQQHLVPISLRRQVRL